MRRLPRVFFGLGTELIERGRYPEAERNLRDALALQRRLFPGPNEDTARTLQKLGWVVYQRDVKTRRSPWSKARWSCNVQSSRGGAQPYPDFAASLNALGSMLYDKGDYDQSVRLLQESMAMNRRLLGEKDPEIATSLNNIANVLQ